MKKLFVILVMLAAINASGQWVQMSNGMGLTQLVNTMILKDSIIFTGTYSGVFLSSNNGSNWSQSSLNYAVLSFAVSGNNLFAGTNGSGVYVSSNNGTNWVQKGLGNHFVYSLYAVGNTVYAGTQDSGLFISTNNGTTWIRTSLNNNSVRSFLISGTNFFAGTHGYGIYLSTDNCLTWTQTSFGYTKYAHALVQIGINIFVGNFDIYNVSDRGVYRSTNNGGTWTHTLYGLSVHSLAVSGNNLFAGTRDGGVYLTKNNGDNWINRNQGFVITPSATALLVKNNYVFAGTWGQSVWRRALSEIVGIQNISTETPSSYSLSQNYPNPFNPTTKIKFDVYLDSRLRGNDVVVLKVYDVMGREVQTMVNEKLQAGTYEATFDGSQLTSGVYFYKIVADNFVETRKMILLK